MFGISKPNRKRMPKSDNVEAHLLLRKAGLEEVETIRLMEIIGKMASENIIARFESKLDSQNSKYNVLIVVIAIVGAALTIAIALQ